MLHNTLVLALLAAALCLAPAPAGESPADRRAEADSQAKLGNFKIAAEQYRLLALDPNTPPKDAAGDLDKAADALLRMGEADACEKFLDQAVLAKPESWRVLAGVAKRRIALPGRVARVDDAFVRTDRWEGEIRDATERDRVAAIQLMLRAEKLLDGADDRASKLDKLNFYRQFASFVTNRRLDGAAWRLTELTDLESLPEPEEMYARRGISARGAPVDADGNPIYHPLPESWQAATNDGQRWRWLLGRMAEFGGRDEADLKFAQFLLGQFGVQTMGRMPIRPLAEDGGAEEATGPFAVRTLTDDETIAKLATGLKRFSPPEEFNHVRLFQSLAGRSSKYFREYAAAALGRIYENRQQFATAAVWWQRLVPEKPGDKKTEAELALRRIAGKAGRLEPGPVAPAGERTRLPYLFRNGDRVVLTAHRLDEKLLLKDIRALLKKNSEDPFRNPAVVRPEQLGRQVVEKNAVRYIAEKTAEWEVKLDPLPDHYSRRTYIEMPFDLAGCYLVEARMEGGNTSRAVVWLADLALVRKPAHDRQIFFVADAATGEPAGGATLSLLGFGQEYRRNRAVTNVREFAETTDADGLAVVESGRMAERNWLVTAETADGRMAYLGFDPVWVGEPDGEPSERETAFVITDRPIYRPGQAVNFTVWLGRATYGKYSEPYLANREVKVEIHSPMGETVYAEILTSDAQGGVSGKLTLDRSAPLGSYGIVVMDGIGFGQFRLEEYRKPEFEVTVKTPDDALLLGDTASVRVTAKYYFGAPVANAKISYKVLRSRHGDEWFPPWRWDWLYGRGASRQGPDQSWYPGWERWGAAPARPAWLPPRSFEPPELVAEGEGALDAEGVFRLPLDTLPAKELYGDRDHRYDITVEVTDRSRRVIVGSGQVVASRKPFRVVAWTDRDYYQAGQELHASLKALLPLGGGLEAKGKAVLYRIAYDPAGVPEEKEAASWDVATGAEGNASLTIRADVPGQYRLSCRLKDAAGAEIEGATLVTVRGDGGGGDFRYAALELLADKREYRPGDTARLAVNSENRRATVILFPRMERAGAKPIVVRLENGTASFDLKIAAADRPNLFCEAITVRNGRLHSEVREIFVPPAGKGITVEVSADRGSYIPGGKATFRLRLTDAEGKPVAGRCAVSLYDRSVEYISGGPNVGDIKAFFWGWKRQYHPENRSSLARHGYTVAKRGDVHWEPIGVFGGEEADWNEEMAADGRGGNGVMKRSMLAEAAPPMAAPMAAPPMADMAVAKAEHGYAMAKPAEAPMAGGAADAGPMAEAAVRKEFADTALWIASIEADDDGRAEFSLAMPENLTAWKARVWTMGPETRVGEGEAIVETKKNVIVRPQAPRFLTQKDQVILSANLHNYLPRAKAARAELVLEGGLLELAKGVEAVRSVHLSANGEARVDWLVEARRPGTARVVMRLLTDEESDAAEITLPVLLHGARRVENFGGVLRGSEGEAVIRLTVPAERLAERSRLELAFSPSIAASFLEALPYLIEYPYGCTEQTLNRFLPVVMTRRYLERLGLSLADAEKAGKDAAVDAKSAEWLKKFGDDRARRRPSPVFDDKELAAMVRQGVERLVSMQCSDGGWGWFSGSGEHSWPHTTAVVVHGLLAAKENGAAIPPEAIRAGIDWLRAWQNREIDLLKEYTATDGKKGKAAADSLNAFVYMILAGQGKFNPDIRDFLYRDRLSLSMSGMAMLGIALHAEKATNALEVVLENLEQYIDQDATGSVWLKTPSAGWWWWYNDGVETQAWYLKLLARVDPKGGRASGVAKYLLRNRKNGAYWRSTRDTAYAIEALAEYAVASGESAPNQTVSIYLDGAKVMERTLTAENILDDNRFLLEGLAVETGEHELRIVRSGGGNLYYGGALDLFSLEDPIAKAGLDLKIDRAYYRLIPEKNTASQPGATGAAVQARVETHRRERLPGPFDQGAAPVELRSGDLVEAELTIETANDYEYLVFEDMKAAGLEAVELVSGYSGNRLGAYVEYRDEKVVLFVRHLPRGKYSLSYRFRAETPGAFSALPVFGGGMYATDLFGNSDEMKVRIGEEGVF